MDRESDSRAVFDRYTELKLMEALETDPETTQADLATRAGVAVGTVNWYLKRWSGKGLVKMKKIGRWRWRYLLTPKGMAEKADLANRYFQASMRIYRQTRAESKRLLSEVQAAGYDRVVIEGDGDIAEIVELTCLQLGVISARQTPDGNPAPRIVVDGFDLIINWPQPNQGKQQDVA
jgi:DNA-binding MarR family transcriptional regulator